MIIKPRSYVVFDFETTGLETRYDQPVQFAAVRLDTNLVELESVNVLARPQNHVIPAPGAIVAHGRSIDEILSASVSHYALMAQIENIVSKWEPATWMGYNSLRFDDEFLRHGLYAGLRLPYLTQYNSNTRSDVLRAAQLANVLEPGSLVVPVRAGKATFRLEALAAANGFAGHEAHDALGDVRATAHVLRTIATGAPSTWKLLSRLADKNAVFQLLRENEFVLVVEHFGAAIARPVIPVCPNPDYRTEWLGIDVTADPEPLLGLSPEELAGTLASQKRRLCRIRANAMPLVVPAEHPAVTRILAANIAPDIPSRVRILRGDVGFPERLSRAAAISRREYPKAMYVEDQLYEGGFFPLREDDGLIGAFHSADPGGKLAVVDAMNDNRARQLGRRILYNEWPEVLFAEEQAMMDEARVARLHTSSAPWTSIAKALAEIEKLMPTASPPIAKILGEYRLYLRNLGT